MQELILASSSKRRLDLLNQLNIKPDYIIAPDIDETKLKKESNLQYVKRMAKEKAEKIHQSHQDKFILAADTIVCTHAKILPKAESDSDVEKCLKMISGKQHTVITSICAISPDNKISHKFIATKVKFKKLTNEEIQFYLDSKEGIGKAGGYGIQGIAAKFILRINGCYNSVVGLPLYETYISLSGLGYKLVI